MGDFGGRGRYTTLRDLGSRDMGPGTCHGMYIHGFDQCSAGIQCLDMGLGTWVPGSG